MSVGEPGCPLAAIPGLSAATAVQKQWQALMALDSPARLFSGAGRAI